LKLTLSDYIKLKIDSKLTNSKIYRLQAFGIRVGEEKPFPLDLGLKLSELQCSVCFVIPSCVEKPKKGKTPRKKKMKGRQSPKRFIKKPDYFVPDVHQAPKFDLKDSNITGTQIGDGNHMKIETENLELHNEDNPKITPKSEKSKNQKKKPIRKKQKILSQKKKSEMAYPLNEESLEKTIFFRLKFGDSTRMYPFLHPVKNITVQTTLSEKFNLIGGKFNIKINQEKQDLDENSLMYAVARVVKGKDDHVDLEYSTVKKDSKQRMDVGSKRKEKICHNYQEKGLSHLNVLVKKVVKLVIVHVKEEVMYAVKNVLVLIVKTNNKVIYS
jgi:hypothetical protein